AYEWVDLGPSMHSPVTSGAARDAGRILGIIHMLEVDMGGDIDQWYICAPSRDRWEHVISLAEDTRQPWAPSLADRFDTLVQMAAFVDSCPVTTSPITCHRDFEPSNVLPAASGGALVTL